MGLNTLNGDGICQYSRQFDQMPVQSLVCQYSRHKNHLVVLVEVMGLNLHLLVMGLYTLNGDGI